MGIIGVGTHLFWHVILCAHEHTCRCISNGSSLDHICKMVEQLFGIGACTPNLHLHGHLQECFLDYGPSDPFWLFAFGRLKGKLGSVSTNSQAIEIQLMRKFCQCNKFSTCLIVV